MWFPVAAAGQVAAHAELRVWGPEVPLAEARAAPRPLFPVQPHGHAGGVCPQRGAPWCGEDEEVSAQTGQTDVPLSLFGGLSHLFFPCPLEGLEFGGVVKCGAPWDCNSDEGLYK